MTEDVSEQARAVFREFMRFYCELADAYERALHQEGISSDGKLAYARNCGMARFAELSEQVNAVSGQQIESLTRVLVGYRQIAASTTQLCGVGSLLARLPEDAAGRFTR